MRRPSMMDYKVLLFVIIFVALLLVSECVDSFWVIKEGALPSYLALKSISINIISTIACAFGASAAWEIFCKKSFTQEVLTLNRMSESCYEGGVEYIYADYQDVDWASELTNVHDLTILFCYGYTWRNHNRAILRNFISSGGNITIYLPDYTCDNLIDELDRRFLFGRYCPTGDKASTEDRIIEANVDFTALGASVKFFRRTLCSLYFVMDEKAIFVPFRHCESNITYPAIRVSNRGCIYKFIQEDLLSLSVYDTVANPQM